jgi:putative lipoprotein
MTFRLSLAAVAVAFLTSALHAQPVKPGDSRPRLARGQMMKQGDKLIFSPCRDRSYVMLEDVSPDREVTRALDSVGLESGKKLYVELLAVVDGGMIRASGLNQARTEGRCQQPGGKEESWRAAGNEPGWLLAVGDEAVALKRPGAADLRLPFKVSGNEGGATRIEAAGEGKHLAVAFERRMCHDPMADSVFGWTATVNVNGETLKGCAWQR